MVLGVLFGIGDGRGGSAGEGGRQHWEVPVVGSVSVACVVERDAVSINPQTGVKRDAVTEDGVARAGKAVEVNTRPLVARVVVKAVA